MSPEMVKVILPEVKGSDVNLAVHLVRDALTDKFDVAYVITDDFDQCEALKQAKATGKPVYIVAPCDFIAKHNRQVPGKSLKRAATGVIRISNNDLENSQLPNPAYGKGGKKIYKPESWVAAKT